MLETIQKVPSLSKNKADRQMGHSGREQKLGAEVHKLSSAL